MGILSIALKANGYCPLSVKKDAEGDWVLDLPEEDRENLNLLYGRVMKKVI